MSRSFSESPPPVELTSCGTQALASSHSPRCRHLLKYSNRSWREVWDSQPKGCMATFDGRRTPLLSGHNWRSTFTSIQAERTLELSSPETGKKVWQRKDRRLCQLVQSQPPPHRWQRDEGDRGQSRQIPGVHLNNTLDWHRHPELTEEADLSYLNLSWWNKQWFLISSFIYNSLLMYIYLYYTVHCMYHRFKWTI